MARQALLATIIGIGVWMGVSIGFAVSVPAETGRADELEAPKALKAGGEIIDVDIGHAAPFVTDFDADGLDDLLVGQFGNGQLRMYRNVGTPTKPRYERFEWFRVGGTLGAIPSG